MELMEAAENKYSCRLKEIMKANHIFNSEIYSQTGTNSKSTILSNPTGKEMIELKSYFHRRLPNFNFDYLVGVSNNPNLVINMNEVNYLMRENNITVGEFDKKMEELGYKDAYHRFMAARDPKEEDVKEIMDFLLQKKDDYTSISTEEKMPLVFKSLYCKDPDNFIHNTIVPQILERTIDEDMWSKRVLSRMLASNAKEMRTMEQFLIHPETRKSLSLNQVLNIEAALQCDMDYLSGSQKNLRVPGKKRYFAEAPGYRDFRLNHWAISDLTQTELKDLAKKSGLGYSMLKFAANNAIKFYVCLHKIDALRVAKIIGKSVDDLFTCLNGATITDEEVNSRTIGVMPTTHRNNKVEKQKDNPEIIADDTDELESEEAKVEEVVKLHEMTEEEKKETEGRLPIIGEPITYNKPAPLQITPIVERSIDIHDVVNWIKRNATMDQISVLTDVIELRKQRIQIEEAEKLIQQKEDDLIKKLSL